MFAVKRGSCTCRGTPQPLTLIQQAFERGNARCIGPAPGNPHNRHMQGFEPHVAGKRDRRLVPASDFVTPTPCCTYTRQPCSRLSTWMIRRGWRATQGDMSTSKTSCTRQGLYPGVPGEQGDYRSAHSSRRMVRAGEERTLVGRLP